MPLKISVWENLKFSRFWSVVRLRVLPQTTVLSHACLQRFFGDLFQHLVAVVQRELSIFAYHCHRFLVLHCPRRLIKFLPFFNKRKSNISSFFLDSYTNKVEKDQAVWTCWCQYVIKVRTRTEKSWVNHPMVWIYTLFLVHTNTRF